MPNPNHNYHRDVKTHTLHGPNGWTFKTTSKKQLDSLYEELNRAYDQGVKDATGERAVFLRGRR